MRKTFFVLALMLGVNQAEAANCALMQRLAQQQANSMARRDHMDHYGFAHRARAGARAENVGYGCATKACAIAMWQRSPPHAANMGLPGCKGVASAVSRSGHRYWAMVIAR
jgi:uncharacterized protein YkwD